jgi:hypothetical protein
MTITRSVATKVIARVIMESFQSPVMKMMPSHTAVVTAGRQPPRT